MLVTTSPFTARRMSTTLGMEQALSLSIHIGNKHNSKIERDRMATNTIADIHPVGDSWIELFTSTGITSGSNVIVENKGSVGVLVYLKTSNTPPSVSTTDGWSIGPQDTIKITAESYIFLRALGPVADVHVETA